MAGLCAGGALGETWSAAGGRGSPRATSIAQEAYLGSGTGTGTGTKTGDKPGMPLGSGEGVLIRSLCMAASASSSACCSLAMKANSSAVRGLRGSSPSTSIWSLDDDGALLVALRGRFGGDVELFGRCVLLWRGRVLLLRGGCESGFL